MVFVTEESSALGGKALSEGREEAEQVQGYERPRRNDHGLGKRPAAEGSRPTKFKFTDGLADLYAEKPAKKRCEGKKDSVLNCEYYKDHGIYRQPRPYYARKVEQAGVKKPVLSCDSPPAELDSLGQARNSQARQRIFIEDGYNPGKKKKMSHVIKLQKVDKAERGDGTEKEQSDDLGWIHFRGRIWEREIEEHFDETVPVNEGRVMRLFVDRIEGRCVQRWIGSDLYYLSAGIGVRFDTHPVEAYSSEEGAKKGATLESLVKHVPIEHAKSVLFRSIVEENRALNLAKSTHLGLKQAGYKTAMSSMFGIASREYVLRKEQIVSKMQSAFRRLTVLSLRLSSDAKYAQRCSELLDSKEFPEQSTR